MIVLRQLRLDKGLTPEELGGLAGVAGMTIRRIEEGKPCRPSTLKKLADFLGDDIRASDLIAERQAA